ncbi:hypothetical protein [Thermodesulfobacterium hveragerdense]|uniref:hypothetical protein n=1 Tax=Thermodesulfobacterium hveragerdense TaxID=53424 RepID=UPI0003F5BAC0|nr:hypothetical protein [Thermodesulfobacterium hveragerdense]
MKNLKLLVGLAGLVVFLSSGFCIAKDSAYDQASGTSGSSWQAEKDSAHPGNYKDLNSSWERARHEAGQGFDTSRPSNLSGGGMQYIPTPTPQIDKELK